MGRRLAPALAAAAASSSRAAWSCRRTAGGGERRGFKTSQPSMLTPVMMPGCPDHPVSSPSETCSSGYRFESIPDGISVAPRGQGRVDVFVNHETSTVPFPYNRRRRRRRTGERLRQRPGEPADPQPAQRGRAERLVRDPERAGYQRFCSNYLATAKEGFDRRHPVHERGGDRLGLPAGGPRGHRRSATRTRSRSASSSRSTSEPASTRRSTAWAGTTTRTPWRSRGSTTWSSSPATTRSRAGPDDPAGRTAWHAQSQLYSYIAPTPTRSGRRGRPVGVRLGRPGFNDYYDFRPGSPSRQRALRQGAEEHRHRARTDGSELKAADVGFPLPPTNGSWQRDNRTTTPDRRRRPAVGARVLESAEQRLRLRPRRGHRLRQAAGHGERRLRRRLRPRDDGRRARRSARRTAASGRWCSIPNDPTKVTSLTVFVEGDDNPVKTLDEIHQPDNIESTPTGILVTEDPGSSQQFPAGSTDPNATTARLWWVPVLRAAAGRREGRPVGRRRARPTSTDVPPGTGGHGSRAGSSTPRRPSALVRS